MRNTLLKYFNSSNTMLYIFIRNQQFEVICKDRQNDYLICTESCRQNAISKFISNCSFFYVADLTSRMKEISSNDRKIYLYATNLRSKFSVSKSLFWEFIRQNDVFIGSLQARYRFSWKKSNLFYNFSSLTN